MHCMCTLFFVLVLRRNHVRRSWKIQRARYTLPRFGLNAKCRGCLKISEQVGGNPITVKEELGDIREPSQMRSEYSSLCPSLRLSAWGRLIPTAAKISNCS